MRNKKRITAIVAAFMVVLLAGSAFALVSTGPLVFNGTAAVDAVLRLEIVHDDITVDDTGTATLSMSNPGIVGYKRADFTMSFNTPGQVVEFDFIVENVGTTPAEIDDIVITHGDVGNTASFVTWTLINTSVGNTYHAGDTFPVVIEFEFDPSGHTGWYLDGEYEFTMHIYYVAGS